MDTNCWNLNVTDVGDDMFEEEAEIMILDGNDYMENPPSYSDAEMPNLSPIVENVYSQQQCAPAVSKNSRIRLGDIIKDTKPTKSKSKSYLDPLSFLAESPETSASSSSGLRRSSRPCPASYKLTVVSMANNAPPDYIDPSPSKFSKVLSPFMGEAVNDIETGELLFPCMVCDKKYKLRSSLESHVKIHEGTENTCPICGQTMSRQRDLKRHVATVHRGLLNTDGTVSFPPDIEAIFPTRKRSKKSSRTNINNQQEDLSFEALMLPGEIQPEFN